MSRKLNLGLFGLGCVGQGFYELLEQSTDANFQIKKIVVKNQDKIRTVDTSLLSTSNADILDNPEIDIVVELIDDAKAAFEILKEALQKRKPVITANKKMLAENLEEIFWLQKKYETPVLYEGSVCGSIPLVRNLESHYAYDALERVEGIFNGSTNYILTKMIEEKKNFSDALHEAQMLGFAESNPALDVQGYDPKYKLAIAIAHAFGLFVRPEQILNIGIEKITPHDIRFARQNNCTIKLIARAEKIGNKIFGLVAPQFIPLDNPLAHVKNEFNGVNILGASTGLQSMTGKGAGSLPTGLVVLSDVFAIASGTRYNYIKHQLTKNYTFASEGLVNVHVSFAGSASISPADFEEFNGGFQSPHLQSMNGWVSTKKLKNWLAHEGLSIILNSGGATRLNTAKKAEEFSLV